MSDAVAKETLNPFEIARKQVKTACDRLKTDPAVYEILKSPTRVLEVKLDDGTVKTFTGYRSRAFPSRCESGRSQGTVDLDDHQMLRCRHSLRRRQRRRYLGSARLFRGGTGTHRPRLCRSDCPADRRKKLIFPPPM